MTWNPGNELVRYQKGSWPILPLYNPCLTAMALETSRDENTAAVVKQGYHPRERPVNIRTTSERKKAAMSGMASK